MASAVRAGDLLGSNLVIVGHARLEPGLEFVITGAFQAILDHDGT